MIIETSGGDERQRVKWESDFEGTTTVGQLICQGVQEKGVWASEQRLGRLERSHRGRHTPAQSPERDSPLNTSTATKRSDMTRVRGQQLAACTRRRRKDRGLYNIPSFVVHHGTRYLSRRTAPSCPDFISRLESPRVHLRPFRICTDTVAHLGYGQVVGRRVSHCGSPGIPRLR